jgi:ADP-ribosylglycohydrolase
MSSDYTTTKAIAALQGLAIGDALGMPTQLMSRQEIANRFGAIDAFHAAANDHPIAAGMPAGSVTDDTEQALLLARLLAEGGGHIDGALFASALVDWEDGMRAKGSLDLLGPSTRRAVEAVLNGESIDESGRFGTTNGAAMRVTPVGIAIGSGDLDALVDLVEETARVTHNTGVAIAGASGVAAAVSGGIDGANLREAVELAAEAASIGAHRGNWVAAADVAARIRWATSLADPAHPERSLTDISDLIGTSLATQESVPAAFGILCTFPGDGWAAVAAAASLGGDTDTVAAMVGAIAGAVYGPGAFPAEAWQFVARVNGLEVDSIARELLALR